MALSPLRGSLFDGTHTRRWNSACCDIVLLASWGARSGTTTAGHAAVTISALFRLDARELHHVHPLRLFLRDEGCEVLRRARACDGAELLEAILHQRGLEADVDLGIELVDDRPRRSGRRHDAGPGACDEVRHAAFDHGGHVRKLRKPRRRSDAERADLALAHMCEGDRGGLEAEID